MIYQLEGWQDAAMTVQGAVLILALLLVSVGVFRDITRSTEDKGAGSGVLDGTFRPQSWTGFARGLPWYITGAFLLAIVAWGNW